MSAVNRPLSEAEQEATIARLRSNGMDILTAEARELGDSLIDDGQGQLIVQATVSVFVAHALATLDQNLAEARRLLSAWPHARTGRLQ